MSSVDISEVTDQLAKTKVDETSVLSFKGKGLKLDNADSAKEIIEGIEKCPKMRVLSMEGNTLGIQAAEAISKVLAKHPEFQRAHWSDMFTGRLKTEIPLALEHLGKGIMSAGANLVELDLSDNAFGPNGIKGVVELLKSPSCYSLQELRLNNNGLGITGGKMLSQSLLDCHANSSKAGKPLALKVFISGRNRLENDGATALAEVFKTLGTLEEIAMPQNGINYPGITALADAFTHNPGLTKLNLNDNTFTTRGSKVIAAVLKNLENLKVINFGDCLVKSGGARILAKALKNGHKNLEELILSGNEINNVGANAIADAMENKENLQVLDLNSNMIGDNGIEEVRGTMESMGKEDALATLSDDEGTADEDEDDDDSNPDDESEGEDAKDDDEGEELQDPELQIQGKAITPQKDVTAKSFLDFPSPQKLVQLGKSRAEKLQKELGSQAKDIDSVVEMFIKVSSVVSPNDDKTKEVACECTDALLEQAVGGNGGCEAAVLANSILVYLGLLKGEDKKYKPPQNIEGPLIVLEHVVGQPYFPKLSRDILSAFLSKPHPSLDKAPKARHKILQTLYAF